ncbi:MAG: DUF4435 domain-containing protein [Lachnobacterium sp.]|nr:DUF4435 domain-containing protein [Lachnobacterium sp.]MCI7532088.1 DUF4435 domain-containing protein [Lachnobacterium sp.]
MNHTYNLPNEQNQPTPYETDSNALIIIGANGAGKSKLGAWIEQQDFENVHRIGAQRNLNFNENISLKNYSQAEDLVFWGTCEDGQKRDKGYRWGWDNSYTTKLMNDFEDVLAALIALKNNENDVFIEKCRKAQEGNNPMPHIPITSIDILISIWKDVFPQRDLLLEDSKFYAVFLKNGEYVKYSANQMSDGERSVLYLVAQVLCVPENKTLIIDEPEIHLHRSIMTRLWMSLEKHRPDCLFIYITHDTQFAAMHVNTDKIWIRDFDGQHWKLEKIEEGDLPEELLLDILGNRNNVLFVEGEKNSFDTQLYTAIYPTYHIIPCGSCSQVIERTKAFNNNPSLHNCNVYGIIDRDYRSDYEIEKYKEHNIFVLNVAEVENLFVTEELIRFMAEHMGKDADEVFKAVKEYVIHTKFAKQIDSQICKSVVAQIKFKLSSVDISKGNSEEAKASLDAAFKSIDYNQISKEETMKFKTILSEQKYAEVIKVFNEKKIAKSIGGYFGIDKSAYCSTVINLVNGPKHDVIVSALLPYFPEEIPR